MKDYKKILEGVMNIINTTEKSDIGFANICAYIGENCPELEESEYERIRKGLVEGFQQYDEEECWRDIEYLKIKDILAWLEKQGEQKPVDNVKPKFKVGDTIRHTIHKYITATISDIKDGEYILSNSCGTHMPIEWQNNYELVEQKSAWSEGDEIKIKSITALLKSPTLCAMEGNKGIIDESIKYLTSLKDRVLPQPKQEWSEEDEKMVRGLIAVCDEWTTSHSFYPIENCDMEKLKNWLKSLKPHNTWKPSIAQLNALSIVSKGNAPDDIEAIVSLYQDLKKLMEK